MKKWTLFATALIFALVIAIPADQTNNAETVDPRPTGIQIIE